MRDGIYFEVVLRHLGLERRMADVKVRRDIKGIHFHAFTPYSLDGSLDLDNHVSYHADGKRHVRSRYKKDGKMLDVPGILKYSVVHFEPPDNLRGAVQIYLSGDPLGQFRDLKSIYRGRGEKILLDVERAGFIESLFVLKIYAVERGNENCIPCAPDAGLRVLHFIKTIDPWIAIEVYQPPTFLPANFENSSQASL